MEAHASLKHGWVPAAGTRQCMAATLNILINFLFNLADHHEENPILRVAAPTMTYFLARRKYLQVAGMGQSTLLNVTHVGENWVPLKKITSVAGSQSSYFLHAGTEAVAV
mmetsp:Transcript_18157/g.42188  ORF Transcript_18157/g.42188 Transcript_18157/m.42188 type:complete len:110 (-) Transcript_18157:431-760(-)